MRRVVVRAVGEGDKGGGRGRGGGLAPAGRVSRVVYYEAREAGGLEADVLLHSRIIVV